MIFQFLGDFTSGIIWHSCQKYPKVLLDKIKSYKDSIYASETNSTYKAALIFFVKNFQVPVISSISGFKDVTQINGKLLHGWDDNSDRIHHNSSQFTSDAIFR